MHAHPADHHPDDHRHHHDPDDDRHHDDGVRGLHPHPADRPTADEQLWPVRRSVLTATHDRPSDNRARYDHYSGPCDDCDTSDDYRGDPRHHRS
jgi:hypothetical protein